MACELSAADCFGKYVAARLPVIERDNGWWSMRCPTGHHGPPLRLHIGTHPNVHITYHDLGRCPQSDTFKWLVKQGVPGECLARPKDWPEVKRSSQLGSEDGKLADAILGEAFGGGTTTERLIRCVVAALGEMPEGAVVEVLADKLGLKPRIIYQATAEMRRRNRDW